jgi:hypothetical protein
MRPFALALLGLILLAGAASHAAECSGAKEVREATPAEVQAWFRGRDAPTDFRGAAHAEFGPKAR